MMVSIPICVRVHLEDPLLLSTMRFSIQHRQLATIKLMQPKRQDHHEIYF
jgi:hypothetical protein